MTTSPTTPTRIRLRASTSGAALGDSLLRTYWETSPMTMKEAKKIIDTMTMILQVSLLENDLLFTWYTLV
jgi:hypothetical protein